MTTHKVVSTVRKMGQRGWSKQETLYQQRQKAQPMMAFSILWLFYTPFIYDISFNLQAPFLPASIGHHSSYKNLPEQTGKPILGCGHRSSSINCLGLYLLFKDPNHLPDYPGIGSKDRQSSQSLSQKFSKFLRKAHFQRSIHSTTSF